MIDLLSQSYNVTALFYNPNIQPEQEYTLRLREMKRLCGLLNTDLIISDYDTDAWISATRGLEQEREGGRRCSVCFELRLRKSAEFAVQQGFDLFTTTLSVSPHKDADLINSLGGRVAEHAGIQFLEGDFKKNNGFKKSCELSRKYGLYRQKYCGCSFARS